MADQQINDGRAKNTVSAEVISWDIYENVLSDGSSTFDVIGTSDECRVRFFCRDEIGAEALAAALNSDDVVGAIAERL